MPEVDGVRWPGAGSTPPADRAARTGPPSDAANEPAVIDLETGHADGAATGNAPLRQLVTEAEERLAATLAEHRRAQRTHEGELTARLDAVEQQLAQLHAVLEQLAARVPPAAAPTGSLPPPPPAAHTAGAVAPRLEDVLGEIEGVGHTRQRSIRAAFGDTERLAAASVDEIAALRGIGRPLATRIRERARARLE